MKEAEKTAVAPENPQSAIRNPQSRGPRHTWVFPFMSAVFRTYLRLGGWKVVGRENIPSSGPVILAPNHQSLLDPPLVGVSCGRWPFIMAKAELFHGIVGWAIEQMGTFPVKRGSA
ncbi:MAG TPA: lysophospholipid acyltransferase family protein, partial [Abditibacterium sp.]